MRFCSSPDHFPPSTSRRQAMSTGPGRSVSSRFRLISPLIQSNRNSTNSAAFHQMPMLGHHVPMPPATNADTNHEDQPERETVKRASADYTLPVGGWGMSGSCSPAINGGPITASRKLP